jgi:putative ABC transport system substrate-binding protein
MLSKPQGVPTCQPHRMMRDPITALSTGRGRNRLNTRRDVIIALAAGAFFSPGMSFSQQEQRGVRRIGLLTRKTDASVSSQIDAFREGLRDLGWIEGRGISIEHRDADGQLDRLRVLAAELVGLNVDVIVTVDTPPTQAAQQATRTIPIVIAVSADPVGAGLVSSLAHPGGNTTGLSLLAPETDEKTLELLKETLPKTKRVAIIFDPNNPGMMLRIKALTAAAPKLAVEFQSIPAVNSRDLGVALAAADAPDALIVLSPIYAAYRNEVVEFAIKARVPLSFDTRGLAREPNALLSYGVDISALFRRAATFVDKILKGATPADLPVEQPTKFEFVINLKTARMLGLTVPPTLLARADEVIE